MLVTKKECNVSVSVVCTFFCLLSDCLICHFFVQFCHCYVLDSPSAWNKLFTSEHSATLILLLLSKLPSKFTCLRTASKLLVSIFIIVFVPFECVCVCACMCVRARLRVCVWRSRTCVHERTRERYMCVCVLLLFIVKCSARPLTVENGAVCKSS